MRPTRIHRFRPGRDGVFRSVTAHTDINRVIAKVGDLPPMPETVSEALRQLEDPTVALSDVSRIIERDPPLTAKLLMVSNSPHYGMKQVVGTLELALVVLGAQEARNILLGVSMLESLRDRNTERLLKQHGFWHHSVLVGTLAKKLGTHLNLRLQGEDFIAGLLHDIGKMMLWRQLEGAYESVYQSTGGASEPLCEAENKAFGFDHAEAAAALSIRWNLPQTLTDSMRCHHPREDRSPEDAKDPQLAALVRVANLAARDDFSSEDPAASRSCSDEEAWGILEGRADGMNREARRELLAGFFKESEEMPKLAL